MRAGTSTVPTKTSPRSSSGKVSFTRCEVMEVKGTIAVVRLTTGRQLHVRADMLPGKSAAPVAGEHWILDQAYGDWRFVIPVGYRGGLTKLSFTIGDGANVIFVIDHPFDTTDVIVQVYDPIGTIALSPTVYRLNPNQVRLIFASPPATHAARVVLMG